MPAKITTLPFDPSVHSSDTVVVATPIDAPPAAVVEPLDVSPVKVEEPPKKKKPAPKRKAEAKAEPEIITPEPEIIESKKKAVDAAIDEAIAAALAPPASPVPAIEDLPVAPKDEDVVTVAGDLDHEEREEGALDAAAASLTSALESVPTPVIVAGVALCGMLLGAGLARRQAPPMPPMAPPMPPMPDL